MNLSHCGNRRPGKSPWVIRNRAFRAPAHPDVRYAPNSDQRIAAPRLGAMEPAAENPTSPLTPCVPLLLERQRRAFRRHHLRDVECHRDGGVVAAHADQIDHTPLAEQRKRAVERRVVDVSGAVKLDAELVNRRFVVAHAGRPLAERKLVSDPRVRARLHGERIMCVPFVLRGPFARGDQDRELVEAQRQRGAVANVFADVLQTVAQIGAAHPRIEGPAEQHLLCRLRAGIAPASRAGEQRFE